MGIFKSLFGKKATKTEEKAEAEKKTVQLKAGDTILSAGDALGSKVIRALTSEQAEALDKSPLLLREAQLYTHYWTKNLVCTDRNDQEWRNMVMFFWKAEEPFPRKSLPPHFVNYQTKYFIFLGGPARVTVRVAKAMPWFGMPGEGDKHVCLIDYKEVTIPELHHLGMIQYLEFVDLTPHNLALLTNKDEYCFLVDQRISPFRDGSFFLQNTPISLSAAFSIGGVHLVKKVGVE